MADNTLNVRLKDRIDTESNWNSKNPVLLKGERGLIEGTAKYKVGDGSTKWSDLPLYQGMTSTDRSKLDGIATGANKTVVDSSMSTTSTNPVQNKVVKSALDSQSTELKKIINTKLPADFDTVNQNVSFNGSVHAEDLTAGNIIVTGAARFNSGMYGDVHGNATSADSVDWSGVKNKPSTYTPSSHNHDDRYYTEAETDKKLDAKSNTGHTHDDRYYTESEVDTKLSSKLNKTGGTITDGTVAMDSAGLPTFNGTRVAASNVAIGKNGIAIGGVSTQNDGAAIFMESSATESNKLIFALGDDATQNGTQDYIAFRYYDTAGTVTYESKIPSKTGTIALTSDIPTSMAWSSITGKPSTYAPSSHTHNYAGSSSAGGAANSANKLNNAFSSRQTSGDIDFTNSAYANKVTYTVATSSMTTGKPPSDGHLLSFGWDTTAGWGAQLNIGDGSGTHMYIRGADSKDNKTVYGDWKTILDSTNYNTYAPSKTGSGASGSWGISVTGSAAKLSSSAGSATQPVYFSDGKPVACTYTINASVPSGAKFTDTNTWRPQPDWSATSGDAMIKNKPALGTAASKTTRTLSAVGDSGWNDVNTDKNYVPDMAFIAYWSGAYKGSSSNLTYCKHGAFGTAATSNKADFATAGHTHDYPKGFAGTDAMGWGVQTGTVICGWKDSTGGSIGFRKDCPKSGQMSMVIDGTVYTNEGSNEVLTTGNYSSYAATKSHNHDSVYLKLSGGTVTGVTSFTNTTASTSKLTGAVKVSGGVGVAGRMSANEVGIGDCAVIKYNSTNKCIDFTFA